METKLIININRDEKNKLRDVATENGLALGSYARFILIRSLKQSDSDK